MVAAVGDLVLLLARHAVLVHEALGEEAHQLAAAHVRVGEGAEQAVHQGHVAVHLVLRAAGEEVARHVAHGLDPAGDAERDLAEQDAPAQAVDRGAAGGAVLLVGGAGHGRRHARQLGRGLGQVGRARILHDPAHARVLDRGGVDPGRAEESLDRVGGELLGLEAGEPSADGTDGRAHRLNDDDLVGTLPPHPARRRARQSHLISRGGFGSRQVRAGTGRCERGRGAASRRAPPSVRCQNAIWALITSLLGATQLEGSKF